MKANERRKFIEAQLGLFLDAAQEGGYITIGSVGMPDE
jgi:hypothetical protein